ncbi:hypothetical protein ACQ4LE_005026 [Meloidogyne hapla]
MPKIGLNEYLNITTGQLIDEMISFFTHCPRLIFFDFFFISLTFACYVFIIARLFCMRKEEQFTTIRHSLFKSLALIILIQIICWSTTFVCYNIVVRLTNTSNELRVILTYLTNYFSSITSSAEIPILFFTSSDHRGALIKEFPRIFKKKTNMVGDIKFIEVKSMKNQPQQKLNLIIN